MIYIGEYEEFRPGRGYPSIKEYFSAEPYTGQGEIIHYLLHGKVDMVSMQRPRDVITGNRIPMEKLGMCDDKYTWWNILAYYVKVYNLRLPQDFEQHILSKRR